MFITPRKSCFACTDVCITCTCPGTQRREEGIRSPGTRVLQVAVSYHVVLETEPGARAANALNSYLFSYYFIMF